MISECIPPEVLRRLELYREAHVAGTIELRINDGRVVGWKFSEEGRVRRPQTRPNPSGLPLGEPETIVKGI